MDKSGSQENNSSSTSALKRKKSIDEKPEDNKNTKKGPCNNKSDERRLKWNRARASKKQQDLPVFDVEEEVSHELVDFTNEDVDAENVTTTSTNSLGDAGTSTYDGEGGAGTSTSDGEGGAGTITSENLLAGDVDAENVTTTSTNSLAWEESIKEMEKEKNEFEDTYEKNKVLSVKLSKLEEDLKAKDSSEKAWRKRERDWLEKEKFWQNKDKELEKKRKECEDIKQKLSKLEEDLRAKDSSENASQKREKAVQEKDKAWQIKEKVLSQKISKIDEDLKAKALKKKEISLEEIKEEIETERKELKASSNKELKLAEDTANNIIENSKNWCSFKDCKKIAKEFCCFNGEKVTKYCSTECSDADSSHKITCQKPVRANLGRSFSSFCKDIRTTSQPKIDISKISFARSSFSQHLSKPPSDHFF